MKKSILLFAAGLIGSIAMTISFLRLSKLLLFNNLHYYIFGVVLLVMIISTITYFKRMLDELRGIPPVDEMTENLSRIASARSFPYSLGLWITILVCSIESNNAVIPICIGIIGMGLTYGSFWLYYKYKGNANEEQNT